MPRHILYAYVQGSDLTDVADDLCTRFQQFIADSEWIWKKPRLVNQRRELDWELGLNLALPDPGHEPPGWFRDVELIANFLGTVHAETGEEFVIGISDSMSRIAEDLFFVDSQSPDTARLRQIVGVKDPG